MKALITLVSLLLFAHQSGGAAVAQAAGKAEPASALLYEITGPGLKKPSYLFGTIHLICEKDMFPSERMMGYLGKTEQLMLEMDLGDPGTMQKVLAASMMADGKTVKDHVTPEEYARIDSLFKEYLGIPFEALSKLKPLMSSTYIFTSPKILGCQPPVMYENYLRQAASQRKLAVIGLETVEEQIAAIDANSLESQLSDLKKTAKDPQARIGEFRKMLELYLSQDSDGLYRYTEKQFEGSGLAAEKLLDARNQRWIPKIEASITGKPTFIAVGAAHLGGKKGVVSLLRAKGYKLDPIRF